MSELSKARYHLKEARRVLKEAQRQKLQEGRLDSLFANLPGFRKSKAKGGHPAYSIEDDGLAVDVIGVDLGPEDDAGEEWVGVDVYDKRDRLKRKNLAGGNGFSGAVITVGDFINRFKSGGARGLILSNREEN